VRRESYATYGGQAVIEGVMFRGPQVAVTAIRRRDRRIETFEVFLSTHPTWQRLRRIPFLRGIIALVDAAANGVKHLQFAAERYSADEDGEDASRSEPSRLTLILGVAVSGVLAFFAGKVLFTAIPAFLAGVLFDPWVENRLLNNLLEGTLKLLLLLGYLAAIGQTPMVKRLFQYHGAEHKVINAYEAGAPLTVRNVQQFSTLHYRCGSSFVLFTILVGVAVYSFFPWETVWERVVLRIALLPAVIGISFEVLQLTNRWRNVPVLRYLGYPGLWLQKLTTREPDDEQVEVAIAAFLRMRELEQAKGQPAGVCQAR
jgi:Predicted metal-dependent enzyme